MILDAPNQMELYRNKLAQPSYTFSPVSKTPRVIQFGPYSWMIDPLSTVPFPKIYRQQISLFCTECHSWTKMLLSLTLTNLRAHWQNHYLGLLQRIFRQAESPDISCEDTTESSGIVDSMDASSSTSNSFFSLEPPFHESSFESTRVVSRPTLAEHALFDEDTYKYLVLEYLLKNNLPFSHVDCPSFQTLLAYAMHCKAGSLPSVSRHCVKEGLDTLYHDEVERFKLVLAKFKGRFAITIDELKRGKDYDYFTVTLHFHNENFVLENHIVGFEVLDKTTSYTGEALYQRIDDALVEYEIKDRIIAITRNNGGSINTSINPFTRDFNRNSAGFQFKGDVWCAGHVLNFVTGAFLNYTCFKPGQTERNAHLIKVFENQHPEFGHVFHRARETPQKVKSIIKSVRSNDVLKTSFRNIVDRNPFREKWNKTADDLLRNIEVPWLSTYKMLDRFLYFRDEITELLRQAKHQHKTMRDEFHLECFELEDSEWKYLSIVRDILQVFLGPTIRLQGYNHETVNLTVPYVARILKALQKWNCQDFSQTNPLIALGLQDACDELLQYYPLDNTDIDSMKTLYLATVLDPRLKLGVFKDLGFSNSIIDAIEDHLLEVYHSYRQEYEKEKGTMDFTEKVTSSKQSDRTVDDMDDFFLNDETILDSDEIRLYLSEKREPQSRTIKEFYESRRSSFPVIYQISKDFLSIMAISSPTESFCSQVKNIVPDNESRLLPGTIRILAILKSRGIFQSEDNLFSDRAEDFDKQKRVSTGTSPDAPDIECTEEEGYFDDITFSDDDD